MADMLHEDRLIKRVLNGDRQAHVQFVEQYKRLVFAMVTKVIDVEEEREDVCQEIFIKAFDKLHTFNGQSKLSTWLASLSYRHALNHRRKHKHFSEESDELSAVEKDSGINLETAYHQNELKQILVQFLSLLPEKYRLAVTLYHQQEMDYKEIEQVTGWPEGTVKSYLFRGRNMLKEKIRSLYEKELTN